MKCQNLFSGKNKKNITNLSSVEFSHSGISYVYPFKGDILLQVFPVEKPK